MSDQPVLFSRAAASCRLTLNREDKCHAINEEMIESLDHYLNEIEKGKNPTHSFAFKSIHTLEQAEVIVREVEWNVSKDKYMKPIKCL